MPEDPKVALVSMPFFSCKRPSIQLGLLKAIGVKHGFQVHNYSFNLDFAKDIGLSIYEKICRHRGRLLGEWLFSVEAFGENASDHNCKFLSEIYDELPFLLEEKKDDIDEWLRTIISIRELHAPQLIKRLVNSYDWHTYSVVGFTSTFQQTTASIALARKLKEKCPNLITIFGGANFDGEMGIELLRKNACIDYVCVGEADNAFPLFLKSIRDGIVPANITGIYNKAQVDELIKTDNLADLSDSPIPDYDEFFSRSTSLGLLQPEHFKNVDIPFESSRGCWWGQKHHCVFCGLNGSTMRFRRKSPESVFTEITRQTSKYHSFNFEAVDNIIDMNYLESLFPLLQEKDYSYNFFYETKANLTKKQLKLMSESGIRRLQPGIESFSPNVLKIMDKGVKAIHNIFLLKWCLHFNITVMWNIIWGFPEEQPEDYTMQSQIIKNIIHFQPPVGGFRIWLERFSPLFFDDQKFKKKYIAPDISYQYIFPRDHDLSKIAYFFHFEFLHQLPDNCYSELSRQIEHWKDCWNSSTERPSLYIRSSHDYIEISDNRNCNSKRSYHFSHLMAAVYLFCHDTYRHIDLILREWKEVPEQELINILEHFCNHGLMISIDQYFLALAVPHPREFKHYANFN